MIEIRNLTHRYKDRDKDVLKDINIKIEQGECIILLGPSGAGKSTLIRCINRLIEPTSGEVLIDGVNILKLNTKETGLIRRKIGLIFQEFNLIERDSVLKNVLNGRLGSTSLWRTFFNKYTLEDYEILEESLKSVKMVEFKYDRVSDLSGGQRQRVAIARTLAQHPNIILADEPVSNLDPKLMKDVMNLLQTICRKNNMTLILSIHFLELIKEYASRVIGIKDGKIVYDGHISKLTTDDLTKIYGEIHK